MRTPLLSGLSTGRVALYIGAIVLKTLLFLPLPLLCQNNSVPLALDNAGAGASEVLDMNPTR